MMQLPPDGEYPPTQFYQDVINILNQYRSGSKRGHGGEALSTIQPLESSTQTPPNVRLIPPFDSPLSLSRTATSSPVTSPRPSAVQSMMETMPLWPSKNPQGKGIKESVLAPPIVKGKEDKRSSLSGGPLDPYGFPPHLESPLSHETFVLVVQNYTSIIMAEETAQFFIVLQSKAVPPQPLLLTTGHDTVRLRILGHALEATLPPQAPGEAFVSVTSGPAMLPVALQMSHQAVATGPYLSALPLTVMEVPLSVRPQPRLAYSTNIGKVRRQGRRMDASSVPRVPVPSASASSEWKALAASCAKFKRNLITVPEFGPQKVKLQKVPSTESERLRVSNLNRRVRALQQKQPQKRREFDPLQDIKLLLSAVDVSMCCSVIPFSLRASLWMSNEPLIRRSIEMFHAELFELKPFGVTSAHIFCKTDPDDELTVFAFNVASCRDADNKIAMPLQFVASLDRFEVPARHCSDPRLWKYVDGAVPSTNEFTSKLDLKTFFDDDGFAFPIPPLVAPNALRRHDAGCSAVKIAPSVYLHLEPWPSKLLTKCPTKTASRITLGVKETAVVDHTTFGGAGEQLTHPPAKSNISAPQEDPKLKKTQFKELSKTVSHDTRNAASERGTEDHGGEQNTNSYGLSLCVGNRLYTSVVGVEKRLVEFIVLDWLKLVPMRKPKDKTTSAPYKPASDGDDTYPGLISL